MEAWEIFLIITVAIIVFMFIYDIGLVIKYKRKDQDREEMINWYSDKLQEYRIREESPIPFTPNIDYLLLKKEVKKYKPPYQVGQRVTYNDEGFVRVGYIHSIRTEQYEIIQGDTDKKEVVVKHAYEIGSGFYTDIIDVVKEDK